MNIDSLRAQWNEVLNQLERENRMAWIAFFDARLAKMVDNKVFLDFSDARKFSSSLEYFDIRKAHHETLERVILEITGVEIFVEELK